MKKLHQFNLTGYFKSHKNFVINLLYYLLLPGLIYSLFNVINWLLNNKFLPFLQALLLHINLYILIFIAIFIIPLKAYQYKFITPASWEKTIFFNYWIYIDISCLVILAFVLAIFTKKIKLRYSWGIYLIILIALRILMHLALHLFGYKAHFDFP